MLKKKYWFCFFSLNFPHFIFVICRLFFIVNKLDIHGLNISFSLPHLLKFS